jgi:hypothetical protein
LGDLKAKDIAVKTECPRNVSYFQVNMPNAGGRRYFVSHNRYFWGEMNFPVTIFLSQNLDLLNH